MRATAASLLAILMLLAALMRVTRTTAAYSQRDFQLLDAPPLTSLDPRVVNILTLGFHGLYDDFVDIWLLQQLMDKRLKPEHAEALQRAVVKTTKHLPKIESLYMLSCFIIGFDMNRPDLCEPFMLDGIKAIPDSWRIPMTEGFMLGFKQTDVRNAAVYLSIAGSRPGVPGHIKELAEHYAQNESMSPDDVKKAVNGLLGGETSRLSHFLEERARPSGEGEAP